MIGIFLLGNAYGQNRSKEKKSSSYKIYRDRALTSNTSALLKEANELKANDPVEALNKVQEALGLSVAQQDEFTEAKCYVLLGEINEGIKEWKLALENYTRAYQKLTDLYISTAEYKRTLQGLSKTNTMLDQYEDALLVSARSL